MHEVVILGKAEGWYTVDCETCGKHLGTKEFLESADVLKRLHERETDGPVHGVRNR